MFVFGMSMAGLADVMNIRVLFLLTALALLIVGASVALLPGLAQPGAEWKRLFSLLRGAEAAPRLGAGRVATIADIDCFVQRMPDLGEMSVQERKRLAAETFVAEAPGGKIIVHVGERSDAAYFILKGSVGVGLIKDEEYIILNYLREGDFFGEVAALTGRERTANVIAEEDSQLLIIPSRVMRQLAGRYETLRQVLESTMAERLASIDLPLGTSLDQNLLRELRTNPPTSAE
jgi:hypothetical protein